MKYSDANDFNSQCELAIPRPQNDRTFLVRLKSVVKTAVQLRPDPARMTPTERRAAGITDAEVDRHTAAHGPLIKSPV